MKRVQMFFGIAAMALLITGQAGATTEAGEHYYLQTGSDLEQVCANPANARSITASERERLLVCGSYIQGFLGHYGLVRTRMTSSPFCLPPNGISGEQVRLLFLALLQQRPQIRDLPASVDLTTSLAWGYSCSRANAKTSQNEPRASGLPAQ